MLQKLSGYRESFLFVPALFSLAAALLALATLAVDDLFDTNGRGSVLGFSGEPDGARVLMATIAGSMVTVASLSFSITVASLALASSQFGPRLLRNFIRDLGNQVVLGTFVGTFLYCLLVLRSITDDFVPYLSVATGFGLAVLSLAVLIYFISHVSRSIQADTVISSIGEELEGAINRLFPDLAEPGGSGSALTVPVAEETTAVLSSRSGYITAIDWDGLLQQATRADLTVWVDRQPRDFVARDQALLTVRATGPMDDVLDADLRGRFSLSDRRAPVQDVEFSVDQLVEVASRALSPGINDPFTALTCIDRLGSALRGLAERRFPNPLIYDADGRLRIVAKTQTFESVVDAAFNQIRRYGQGNPAISMRLMETLAVIAEHVNSEANKQVLLKHAKMIERGSRAVLNDELDLRDIDERYRSVLEALEAGSNSTAAETNVEAGTPAGD